MSYGLIYKSDFDSFDSLLTFRINIYKKNYTGDEFTILLNGSPAVQEWQEDDPKAPIKGASLKVSIIADHNAAGFTNVHLSDFFSNEDDTFGIELIRKETDEILFTGYLVQDDCSEVQIDSAHEINLSFTDNLGLLKDVSIFEASQNWGTITTTGSITVFQVTTTGGVTGISIGSDTVNFVSGQQFTINSGDLAGTYTFTGIFTDLLYGNIITVLEILPTATSYSTTFSYRTPIDLNDFISLKEVIRLCLQSTNIALITKVFTALYPVGGTTGRWLDDTFIDGRSLKSGDAYLSCYDVLQLLMSRFNATLFQARGRWNIVRWGELFQYIDSDGMDFPGFSYSYEMNYIGTIASNDNFQIGNGNDIQSGWLKAIIRPYKYTKEKFDYNQLPNLLWNANANDLGGFRQSYAAGGNSVFEYDLPGWYDYDLSPGPYPDKFVRVTYDTNNKELERIIVVDGSSYNDTLSIQSNDIYLNLGDYLNYTLDFKSENSIPGSANITFGVRLTDGTTTYYLNSSGQWVIPPTPWGITINIPAGDNMNQWHSVNIVTNNTPIDGKLNIFLVAWNITPSPMNYQNISLEITSTVNGSKKITGHTHTTSQNITTKNISDKDISFDDGPLYTKSGCLFLDTSTGIIRDRTTVWNYGTFGSTYDHPLGFWTTFENIYQNANPITKFNGTILNIKGIDSQNIMSPLSCFKYLISGVYLGNRFITGSVSIDYKAGTADITLYDAAYEDFTIDQFLGQSIYNFEYIYNTN